MLKFLNVIYLIDKGITFATMKKIAILMNIVLLSVLLLGQAQTAIPTLHLLANTEQASDSSIHFADNCEEDHFTKTKTISIFIPFKNCFSIDLNLNTIMGIPPFLWQPPK